MDNTWQVKCGSALQSTLQSNAPSSSRPSRNQMEITSGQLLYPSSRLDLRSQVHGMMTDHTFHGSGHTDLGNSFLGILSGPPSLLQCDFQDFSNPKLLNTTNKPPVNGGGSSSSAAVSGIQTWPLMKYSSGLLSENVSCQNMRSGTAAGSDPVLRYSHRSSDQASVIHLMDSDNKKIKDVSSSRGEWRNVNTGNSIKLQNMNCQLQPKMPLEAAHSVSNLPAGFSYPCPRVVCSGTSGDLLLSNTGHLGILCSCHRLHMSVSKFCEHSGLWNVNPGDAIRMESGESIAQWRRLYFPKFGQRDHWMVMFL